MAKEPILAPGKPADIQKGISPRRPPAVKPPPPPPPPPRQTSRSGPGSDTGH